MKRFLALIMLLAGVLTVSLFFPTHEWVTQVLAWVDKIGPWGLLFIILFYIPATVLFFPGSLITLGAGFLFGLFFGTLAVSLGSILGASAAFWCGRTLARHLVEKRVSGNPKFLSIDRAIGEHGFKITLLTRLTPVFPFNFLNYSLGLTRVAFKDYFFASWIGMFPGTVMYVYVGSAAKNLAALAAGEIEMGMSAFIFYGIGLIATILVTIMITRIATRALAEATRNNSTVNDRG